MAIHQKEKNAREVQAVERSPAYPTAPPATRSAGRRLAGAGDAPGRSSVGSWSVGCAAPLLARGVRRGVEGFGLRAVSVRLERIDALPISSDCVCPAAPAITANTATPVVPAVPAVQESIERGASEIRVLQINAGGNKIVNAEICALIASKKIDVVLAQEPYSVLMKEQRIFTSLRRGTHAIAVRQHTPKAFVAIPNPEFHAFFVSSLSTTHCTVVEVQAPRLSFYAVSCYFQYRDDIERHLRQLERVLESLRGKRLVIGLDANAESSLWSPRETNAKGEQMEALIAAFDLHVVNKATQPPTFEERGATSYIDVTLVSTSMVNRVEAWTVRRGWTSSDHNAITFSVRLNEGHVGGNVVETGRFNIRRADWQLFGTALKEETVSRLAPMSLGNAEEVESAAGALTASLINACEKAMPRKRRIRKTNPWWSRELTAKKIRVYRARRSMQQQWDRPGHQTRQAEYRVLLRDYSQTVKRAKIDSWRAMVTSHGNAEPWGIVYKQLKGKLQNDRVLNSLRKDGDDTLSMLETANRLLEVHVPDDDPAIETPAMREVRDFVSSPPATEDAPPFEKWEIALVLSTLKYNKAPGLDLIEVRVLKEAFRIIPDAIVRLFNACLEHGVFPAVWKQASLVFLFKGGDKDASDPKSYRPISLLSVIGKVFERLVIRRLSDSCLAPVTLSRGQFGFRACRSTEDAIIELRRLTSTSTKKYVNALLFDVKGAFDCIWRQAILRSLKEMNCQKNVYRVLSSYFRERSVQIGWASEKVSKTATRGCPRGSAFGPSGWNLGFNPLLRSLEQGVQVSSDGVTTALPVEFVAYADDLAVLVEGDSRAEIERLGQVIVDHIAEQCAMLKLELSETKTVGISVKGPKVVGSKAVKKSTPGKGGKRYPIIKLNGKSIKFETTVRYLGVFFDENFGTLSHCKYLREKVAPLFRDLRMLARTDWGLGFKALKVIYRGVFGPTVCYASVA